MTTKVTEFSIEVPAKWVLTGEHSVLRGGRAIAFPYPKFKLTLTYSHHSDLVITANPFQSQIRVLISRALEFLNLPLSSLQSGLIDIQSQIPIGAGLGSSAALCVAISRLVLFKTGAGLHHWIPLATHLEHTFHGKSSGMDVSVIAEGAPCLFSMKEGAKPLPELSRLPKFELYDSGLRGITKECIEKVKHWHTQNPHLLEFYDGQMSGATDLAEKGLLLYPSDRTQGLFHLREAMNRAQNCFETWGLMTPELFSQKHELLKQGALAVKLTGAGLGGFWAALWPDESTSLDKLK